MTTEPDASSRRMFDIQQSTLDDHGNRVIDIELPALRTHPQDIQRLLRARGPIDVTYEAVCGDHRKTGDLDADRPHFQLRFEKGRDPEGVWQITVRGTDLTTGKTRDIWTQSLFVQTRRRISAERLDELAQRYAPVFLFSGTERHFPVSLSTLFESEAIATTDETMKIRTVFGTERITLSHLGEFMRFNGHSEYLLDFNVLSMWRSVFASLGGDPKNATVYYSCLEDPDSDRFFINYHLFYAFDTKTGLSRLTGIGPHVFDRESMMLVFEGEEPVSMVISGHLENQTIALLGRLKTWTQGRVRIPYADPRTLKIDGHPVIAVADGSHALYPTSGVYQLSLLKEVAGYIFPEAMPEETEKGNGSREPIKPDQVLAPPRCDSNLLAPYALRALSLDRLTSHLQHGDSAYLSFSGYWVDIPGTRNARFPPFTRKETEAVDWVEQAYEWNWDDLPEKYHHNNGLILRFLRENLEDL